MPVMGTFKELEDEDLMMSLLHHPEDVQIR